MAPENESPTGGTPGAEVTERPKVITCPCCESIIFRNGELKKKGARMIELEKSERECESLSEEVSDLKAKLAARQPEAPAVPETPATVPAATPKQKRGFLIEREA